MRCGPVSNDTGEDADREGRSENRTFTGRSNSRHRGDRYSAGLMLVLTMATFAGMAGRLAFFATDQLSSLTQLVATSLGRSEVEPASSLSSSVWVEVHNEYTKRYGRAGEAYNDVPGLGPNIVEPHRETLLRLSGGEVDDGDKSYDWDVFQITNIGRDRPYEFSERATSSSIYVVLPKIGEYTVVVTESQLETATRSAPAQKTFTLWCRYVRRNLRQLHDDDRDLFFDAVKIMSSLSTSDGQQVYGSAYRSLHHYSRVHLQRAGGRLNDKMHDGMGFLTQHVAITNEFEMSLQAINPKISCPYWDYTEDMTRVRSNDGDVEDLWKSDLWSDSWFGNATGSRQHVRNGRFAYQTVAAAEKEDSIHNPYGYARAPWNVNKSPFVTRLCRCLPSETCAPD